MDKKMIKRIYRKDLEGKMVYPIWRLDKNISWFNITQFILGIIYGILMFEWLRKKQGYMLWRFKPIKIWLPTIYAEGYCEEVLINR